MFRKYGTSMLLLPQGNLYIAPHSESETLQEGRQGTWVSSNTLCDLILPTFIKKEEFVCLVESAVRRMERQKRQSADKISHHSCWLVATPLPLPRFFCLRKLHKFNNSIVRNYFPPHYESFVKRLNFHLPALLLLNRTQLCGGGYLNQDQQKQQP